MAKHSQKDGPRSAGREDGVVALEFVILFPLFMLILVGLLEFGHLFYVRHTLTNASREGARAAVMFHSGTAAQRITWATGTDPGAAQDTVNKFLNPPSGAPRLPGVTWTVSPIQVLASGSSAPGTTGSTVTVKVTATDVSLVLGKLVDAFQNLAVSGQTTMKME